MDFKFVEIEEDADTKYRKMITLTGEEYHWNVLVGCQQVTEGCKNCIGQTVFEHWANRSNLAWKWSQVKPYPYLLDANINRFPPNSKILVAPTSDLFQKEVPENFISSVLDYIQKNDQQWFFIQTKYPARMKEILREKKKIFPNVYPLKNLATGISCENQRTYNERIVHLIETPSTTRYVIFEPLLEQIRPNVVPLWSSDLLWPLKGLVQTYLGQDADGRIMHEGFDNPLETFRPIDWVVIGGEKGEKARPAHPFWVSSLVKTFKDHNIPVYFKGFGEFNPIKTPDLVNDHTLIIMSPDNYIRGKGAGGVTNYLNATIDGLAKDIYMTRQTVKFTIPPSWQELPPDPRFESKKMRLTDMSAKAKELQDFSRSQDGRNK